MNTLKTVETPMKKVTIIWDEVRVTFQANFENSKEKFESSFKYIPENFSRREVFEEVKEFVGKFRGRLNLKSVNVWTFIKTEEQYYDKDTLIKSMESELFLFDGLLTEKKASDKPLDIIKMAEKNIKPAPGNY